MSKFLTLQEAIKMLSTNLTYDKSLPIDVMGHLVYEGNGTYSFEPFDE